MYHRTCFSTPHVYLDTHNSEQEARTTLAAVLIVTILLLIAVLRKLGTLLADIDRKRLSEAALLKQVAGLRQEYDRLMSTQGGERGPKGEAGNVALLQQQCQQLQVNEQHGCGLWVLMCVASKLCGVCCIVVVWCVSHCCCCGVSDHMYVCSSCSSAHHHAQEQRDAAVKAQHAAEANAAALKSQAKGLENEYDRLLADFDSLQVQLARGGDKGSGWAAKKGS